MADSKKRLSHDDLDSSDIKLPKVKRVKIEEDAKKPRKRKPRCFRCKKRLTPSENLMRCDCKHSFCMKHRLPFFKTNKDTGHACVAMESHLKRKEDLILAGLKRSPTKLGSNASNKGSAY